MKYADCLECGDATGRGAQARGPRRRRRRAGALREGGGSALSVSASGEDGGEGAEKYLGVRRREPPLWYVPKRRLASPHSYNRPHSIKAADSRKRTRPRGVR
jgi:hypothetical protein